MDCPYCHHNTATQLKRTTSWGYSIFRCHACEHDYNSHLAVMWIVKPIYPICLSMTLASKEAKAQWSQWQKQGLFIFMLPAYCPELNAIETQWHQLKAHEISGRMFDNEYDLAMTVIAGMKGRAEKGEYVVERFKFNST